MTEFFATLTSRQLTPAVFLDRDGVINRKAREGYYITRTHEFELLPGVTECVKRLNHAGFPVIIITNQRGVATGSIAVLDEIHEQMLRQFAEADANITAIYVCPHDYSDGCDCRKPLPGMLLKAAADHDLDLANSWMIGDSNGDVQAGKAAGCHTIRIATGILGSNETMADYQAADLLHAIQRILKNHEKADLLPVSPPLIGLPAFEYDISWLLLD